MKAYVINKFGKPEVFERMEVPKPKLKPGHLLIKVMATSINPLDVKIRRGDYPDRISGFPMILQGDVAGIVEEVGDTVMKFKKGDAVYGCAGGIADLQGALAEWMLVDANLMAHKPDKLSFKEAAALPLVTLTAWEALVRKAHVGKGLTVLIHGGTGGVGHIAIQLAKWLGAKVYSTGSDAEKLSLAKMLGADGTINYKTKPVDEYVREYTNNVGFDVILDTVGGENIHSCIKATAAYGQIVSILPSAPFDSKTCFGKSLSIHWVFQPLPLYTGINREHYGNILTTVASLANKGIVRPLLDHHEFKIDEVAEAHALLESGKAVGKIVLRGFE